MFFAFLLQFFSIQLAHFKWTHFIHIHWMSLLFTTELAELTDRSIIILFLFNLQNGCHLYGLLAMYWQLI